MPQFAVAPAIRFLGAPVAPSEDLISLQLYVLLYGFTSVLFLGWLYLTAAVWCLPCLPRKEGSATEKRNYAACDLGGSGAFAVGETGWYFGTFFSFACQRGNHQARAAP